MTKTKFAAALLALILIFSSIPFGASADFTPKQALPLSAGIEALRGQFEADVAPEANGYSLDYRYYSPVGENDTTKYPIVIFLHGIGHGAREGSQLADSGMPYWSSAELQARFSDAGGAFILLPRAPEQNKEYWGEAFIEPLRALIDDFIVSHKDNVDTTRIAISGSSAGGGMVWFMLEAFPEYFSAAFPVASTETPSEDVVKAASGTAVWLIASKKDLFVNYRTSTLKIWKRLLNYNDRPADCRLSTFGTVINPDGQKSSDNHHLANVITFDLHTLDGGVYPNVETIDGTGAVVDLSGENGLISWIASVHSDYQGEPDEGTGNINITFFTRFFNSWRNIILYIVHVVQVILGL